MLPHFNSAKLPHQTGFSICRGVLAVTIKDAVKSVVFRSQTLARITNELYTLYVRRSELKGLLHEWQARRKPAPDGFRIPPGRLMHLVAGTSNIDWFFKSGKAGADSIRSALDKAGRPYSSLNDVLDWGCGCGRVLRHLMETKGPRLFGCDYNRALIKWSASAYSGVKFSNNEINPPLPYPDNSFDLAYGLSIFTHLPAGLQTAWIMELCRIIRPGGFALITFHGEHYLPQLTPSEAQVFRSGQLVVREHNLAGSNICGTYCSDKFVRQLARASGFEVVLFEPEGAKGNPRQNLYLLQKR